MPESNSNALTIFDPQFKLKIAEEHKEAIASLISGTTPAQHIKTREGPKDRTTGKTVDLPYVTISYALRQFNLITGFSWSHKVISETILPNWWKAVEHLSGSTAKEDTTHVCPNCWHSTTNKAERRWSSAEVVGMFERCIRDLPKEIIVSIELTAYDRANDVSYSHTATGRAEVRFTPDGKPVSIGNARKGAESDALKKGMSMFGLFSDVYGPREEKEAKEEAAQ